MQEVLIEDEPASARDETDLRSTVRVAIGWARRHAILAAVLVVVLVVATVATAVVLPRWSDAAARRELARPAASPGFLHEQGTPPVPYWSAEVPWDARVLQVGDTVVTWSPSADETGVTGLDLVTGAVRWRAEVVDGPRGTRRHCLGVTGGSGDPASVVCLGVVARGSSSGGGSLVSQTGPLEVLDADDGDLVARHEVDGAVAGVLSREGDVVLVVRREDALELVREEARTGQERWRRVLPVVLSPADLWRIRLEEEGGVVLVAGVDPARVVDAATGRSVVGELGGPIRLDSVALLTDGSVVARRYGSGARALSLTSTVYGADGEARFSAVGAVHEPAITDDPSGQLYAWSELSGSPFGGRVRAVDRATGLTRWRSMGPSAGVLVDVAGVAVLKGAGYVIGTDARTGEQLWREQVSINTSADLMTDGTRLLLVRVEPGRSAILEALMLADGSTAWEVELPDGVTRVEQHGTHLLALGPGLVVALR